jgi:DNA-binding transcriptional MerR regulator
LTLLYITVIMIRMTGSPVTQWTLDQLAERVGAALSVDYDGQASGRVREVPDQRAIRYYTTIGLVDRPAAMRGRTALYVRRHLLQLVAIKRLQASGLTLARIQRELAGATDGQLERVARIPPLEEPAASAPEPPLTPASRGAPVPAPRRRAFWKQTAQAVTVTSQAAEARPPAAMATPEASARGAAARTPEAAGLTSAPAEVVVMQGVRLGDGVTLLLEGERALEADDVAAIRAAAGPLLDLVRRGRERS